jgi:hypothetical protein
VSLCVCICLGWLNKKAHRAGNWKRRWFVLALTDTPASTAASTYTDTDSSQSICAPTWTATLCYYKDTSKRELKGYHTLSSTSTIVGLDCMDTDPQPDAHTNVRQPMKPHVKHAFRFKLFAAGSDDCADDCYYDPDGNIHSSLSVGTNQSSEFMFCALSSEDGSTGDRTSVDSSANTQAQQQQQQTPTRRHTHSDTNTNSNTNNHLSP